MRSGSTSRPLYVPHVGHTRCARFGCPQLGQVLTRGASIECVARRLSRRDLEVFRFGTAMTAAHYSHNRGVDLLERFDEQLRRAVTDEDGLHVGDGWSAVLWRPPDVERAVARLRELPGHAEWKLYGHDPADLPERLRALGLEPQDEEAVMVAEAASLPATDADVRVADTPELVDVFQELAERAFGHPAPGVRRELLKALAENEPSMLAVLAFAAGRPASSGRIDFNPRSEFAGLYGGSTLPEQRGRGLYRATVAERARLARERGYRWVYVDALPTSRPILERLGFVQLTTTTPYVFKRG
jgi:GNAT superfamily N-acetyltransferase